MQSVRDLVRNPKWECFDCALIAEKINGKPGLECIAWLLQHDPHISCILLTQSHSTSLLLQAMRTGVCDVLVTPLDPQTTSHCLERALNLARNRRGLINVSLQARDARELHKRVVTDINVSSKIVAPVDLRLETAFFPAMEAGGDFIRNFPLDDNRILTISGDVSGHNLSAGFLSAYFLGMCRGMLASHRSPEAIFQEFHDILVEEWNGNNDRYDIPISVSASFLLLDFSSKTISCCCNGAPQPILCDEYLNTSILGECNPPLGWFAGRIAKTVSVAMPESGSIVCYSDGLLDLDDGHHICPLAKADAVLGIPAEESATSGFLRGQRDDVFVHRISWAPNHSKRMRFIRPICNGICHVEKAESIDECQKRWDKALQLSFPGLAKARRMEILLCCREAALNAVEHGSPVKTCQFTIACHGKDRLCVRVHASDWTGFIQNVQKDNRHTPFGMKIIKGYADSIVYDATNNIILLEFLLTASNRMKPPTSIQTVLVQA